MSALGQKQTFAAQKVMSALPPIATFIAHFGVSARSGQTPLDEMRWLLIQIDPSGINFVFLNFLNSLTDPL
jgi:hypothetical protein